MYMVLLHKGREGFYDALSVALARELGSSTQRKEDVRQKGGRDFQRLRHRDVPDCHFRQRLWSCADAVPHKDLYCIVPCDFRSP